MEIRAAAKGLVTTEDSKILFVAGQRGMWNLVGGGIDDGETPRQAFMREVDEEILGLGRCIDEPKELFGIEGRITTSTGKEKIARWTVFKCGLIVPTDLIIDKKSAEITGITAMTPMECIRSSNMSELAKRAVAMSLRSSS